MARPKKTPDAPQKEVAKPAPDLVALNNEFRDAVNDLKKKINSPVPPVHQFIADAKGKPTLRITFLAFVQPDFKTLDKTVTSAAGRKMKVEYADGLKPAAKLLFNKM